MAGFIRNRIKSLSRPFFAFELFTFLTALASQAALLSTGQLHPAHQAALPVILFTGALFRKKLSAVPSGAWNAALLLVLAASTYTALFPASTFETVFRSLCYFLAYVLLIRYMTRTGARDMLIIIVLSFLMLCAAGIMTISPLFLAPLVLFMGCAAASLMLYVINKGKDEKAGGPSLPARLMWFPFAAGMAVFVIGAFLFFMIPRVGRGLFAWKTSIHFRVPGFSDRVELGSVGRHLQRNGIALRVKLDREAAPSELYLRGNALDYYNGRSWQDTRGHKKGYYYRYEEVVVLTDDLSLSDTIRQEIVMEPTDGNVLFAMPYVQAVSTPFQFRAVVEYWNDYIGLPLATPIYDRVVYTAWSRPGARTIEECREAFANRSLKAAEWLRRAYIQLPEGSDEIVELARSAAGDADSPCEQAAKIREYLAANYTYDLFTPSDRAEDPLHHFLFESRRGYCEHFATAMALMLRGLDIPCRIVGGYHGSYYNPIEDYHVVRESNAHTWVEMMMPGGEWLLLDPTPPAAPPPEPSPWLKWVQDVYDAARYRWDRYVIDLSLRDQYRMASSLRNRGALAGRSIMGAPRQLLAVARSSLETALVLAVIAALALYLLWVGRIKPGAGRDGQMNELVKRYIALLRSLRRKGIAIKPSETASELAERIEAAMPGFSPLFKKAVRAYLDARFGHAPDPRPACRLLKDADKSLRKAGPD